MKNLVIMKVLQKKLGYTNEEMDTWKSRDRNREIAAMAPGLLKKRLVLEVV